MSQYHIFRFKKCEPPLWLSILAHVVIQWYPCWYPTCLVHNFWTYKLKPMLALFYQHMLCNSVIHKVNQALEPCVLATHQLTCNRWCKNYTKGFNGGMWHSLVHPNWRSSKFGAKLWCLLQNPYVSSKVNFCNLEVFIFCGLSLKVFKES
jgi:hypothetical protein